jgi:signal peptidase I
MAVESDAKKSQRSGLGDMVRVVIHALILAMIVRVFFYQPFNIPSGSMIPTLLIGDYLFVSKFSYGYSKYSFPFSPDIGHGRYWSSPPKRGDVAVFKLPSDNETDYIKRVIGLPHDEIQMKQGVLYINGKAVPKERVDDFILEDAYGNKRRVARYRETLPEGVSYYVLDQYDSGRHDNTRVFKVPEGHYFMMGDNRDNSSDSRESVGYVPLENFVGRAEIIFFSTDQSANLWEVWRWPMAIRWSRFFGLVD